MENIHLFINSFEAYYTKRLGNNLYWLLNEGPKCWILRPEHKALALKQLLTGENGLLRFLEVETDVLPVPKSFVKAILEGFHFLLFILKEYVEVYRRYAMQTMKICIAVLSRKGDFYIKRAAGQICELLLRSFPNEDFQLQTTIERWMAKRQLYKLTDMPLLLKVMCAVAFHQPDVVQSPDALKQLVINQFFKTCKTNHVFDKYGKHIVNINIESMNDMFHNFPLESDDANVPALYGSIKHIGEMAELNKDFILIATILHFMNRQMTVFKSFIHIDYEYWHQYFTRQTSNDTNNELAVESLKIYYGMMDQVLYEDDSAQNQTILQNFDTLFVKNITDECVSSEDLRLSITGYSLMLASMKKAKSEAIIVDMYATIACRILSLYFSEDEAKGFDEIADYQEALSRIIIHITHVSSDQIKQLSKLCLMLIKRFPELSPKSQEYSVESFKRTICNIDSLEIHVSRELITSIIFEGILWSCSHSLLVDVELQCELENLPRRPICYKDYLPLWKGLLDPEKNSQIIVRRITNQLIETCGEFILKLNFKIGIKKNYGHPDLTVTKTAENQVDFRVFLNMVGIYVALLPEMDAQCLKDELPQFVKKLIKTSQEHPLISGIYHLVDRILNINDYFQDQSTVDPELFKMILQYLHKILDSVNQYPHELQVACVQLIIRAPIIFAKRIMKETVPIFKIALSLGLNNYALANSAVQALEQYMAMGNDETKRFVEQLITPLELYLRIKESNEICIDSSEGQLETAGSSAEQLKMLQNRILLFFGRIDNSVMRSCLHQQSLDTGGMWDKNDLLKYYMNFPDTSLVVDFKTMLPRIIDSSLNCNDERTRLANCELLHSIVVFSIGKTKLELFNTETLVSFYKTLCSVILRLGCDSDECIKGLFNPLMLQMTHFLSLKPVHSTISTSLIDALFDGLSDEMNFALRNFSGICLAEFSRWIIEYSSDPNPLSARIILSPIVEIIANFALRTSHCQRVAAAIAFNYLYKILAKNTEVVNIYWFELLYSFVKSMNGCSDINIRNSIDHIEKVLISESYMFNEIHPNRKIPPEFSGGTLKDALFWLLSQCGVLDENARKTSMELFKNLAHHVADYSSAKSAINDYVGIHGIAGLNKIILESLNDTKFKLSVENLKIILRTLDCYNWLLRDQLIDNNLLFSEMETNRNFGFNYINNLILEILNNKFDELRLTDHRNGSEINFLCYKTIRSLFDFIMEILGSEFPETFQLYKKLLNKNMFTLISRCLLEPHRVGFDMKNIAMMDSLPNQLEKLLNTISTHTSSKYIDALVNRLDDDITNASLQLFKVKQDSPRELLISLSVTKGLLTLQKCDIFKKLSISSQLLLQANDKSKSIFHALKLVENTNIYCVELEADQKDYLEHLLEIHLNHQATAAKMLIEIFLTDKTQLRVPASRANRKILHSEYFFNTFRDVISRCLLNDLMDTLQELFNWLQHNPDIVFFVIEQLATYLQQHRDELEEVLKIFANELIIKFSELENAINNFESRENSFMNIYKMVVRFEEKPFDISIERRPMYMWILNELSKSTDLSKSTSLLNNFLICLTGENADDDYTIKLALKRLKNHRGDMTSGERNTLLSAKAKECYQSLLTLLPITKSNLVYYTIINFSMGAAKFFCNEATFRYLQKYFDQISPTNAIKSLMDAYRLFMSTVTSNERLDVLNYFLLPSIKSCHTSLLEQFYDRNVVEIFKEIYKQLPDNPANCQRVLVSQIGSYSLIELMFARLELTSINDKYSAVACEILRNSTNGSVPQRVFFCTFEVRKLKTDIVENKDILRQLHCAALNCCITIASVMRKENYFTALFAEDVPEDQLIWHRIVDCDKKYQLAQTFLEFPKKRRVLLNIKQAMKNKSNKNSANYSCIKSYNLASSTFNDDVHAYDFSEINLLKEPSYSAAAVTLEVDELNNHECMPSICGILKVMTETDPEMVSQSDAEPPMSLRCFANSMSSVQYNARLFMLKIILNNQAAFKKFAEIFLLPIINIIILMLNEGPLNYVVRDALLVLINWASIAVPKKCKEQAQEMFSAVIDKVDALEMTKYIVRYNFSIVEQLVHVWHKYLDVPRGLTGKMKDSQACAIRVILILLTNKMENKLKGRADIVQFLIISLNVFQDGKEDILLQICEAIGLILRIECPYTLDNLLTSKDRTLESIREILCSVQKNSPERLVKCVHALTKSYPILSQFFFEFVSHDYLKLTPPNKGLCMEVFQQKIKYMAREDIVRELNCMKFCDLLRHKVTSCEKICLKIIQHLVSIFDATDIFTLANLAIFYSQHENLEYKQLTYDIFISIYKKYADDITEDQDIRKLLEISTRVLLAGTLESNEQLQQKIMIFWTEEIKFKNNCAENLLDILNLYHPHLEDNFLSILISLMLEFAKKYPNYHIKMFGPLVQNSQSKNYEIAALWRVKNLSCKIPLFASSSYASQYCKRYTLSSLTANDSISEKYGPMLRATDVSEFEAIMQKETYVNFDSAATEVPSTNILSQRFTGKLWSTKHPKTRRTDGNYTRDRTQKSETNKQIKKVKLHRTYRIGDFPDIEISHESFVNPLQELIKQDQLVCEDLAVSMICSLIDQSHDNRFLKKLKKKLNNILENHQGNGNIISVVLKIMIYIKDMPCNPNVMENVLKATEFKCLGALLLEQNLISNPQNFVPPTIRRRTAIGETVTDSNSQIENWIQLAALYESIDEVDVAVSIFRNHVPGPAKLHAACDARAANKLEEATAAYFEVYQSESGTIKQYSHQAMIECFGRLSKWEQISDDIQGNTDEDMTLDNIINHANNLENGWLSTWYLRAGIYSILNETRLFSEIKVIPNELIEKLHEFQCLKELVAEEIAAMCAIHHLEVTRDFLNIAINKVREQWTQLSPLFYSLRAREIIKMRGIYDVDLYEKNMQDPSKISAVLLNYWTNSIPDVQDDLLPWDYHISYRSNFMNGLMSNTESTNNRNMNDSIEILYDFSLSKAITKLRLRMIEVGFLQKNKSIMKKYKKLVLRDIKSRSGKSKNPMNIIEQYYLNQQRYNMLRGETGNNADKLKFYCSGWNNAEKLLADTSDINVKISVQQLISDFSLKVCQFKTIDNEKYLELIKNIGKILSRYQNVLTGEFGKLHSCIITNLKTCCIDTLENSLSSDKIADCHLKLLKFCNDRIIIDPTNAEIIKEFVRSTLKAICYGSREAAYYFPCLLKPEYFEDAETKAVFIKESGEIPSWRFLKWRGQLLLALTSLEEIVTPLLQKLIDKYPNPIIYTLRLIIDTNPELSNHPAILRCKQRLSFQPDDEKFVEALQYLVRPELYLQYYLSLLLKNLDKGKDEAVNMVLRKVYPESHTLSLPGKIYKSIAIYRECIESRRDIPEADLHKYIVQLREQLDVMLSKNKDSKSLMDYSPYLCQLRGSNIEVPGQYTGKGKPILQYHTKIVKIESNIQVMTSHRKPIKITFIGNDGKKYNFLVKFGADLRLDEKAEQAFEIMNEILQTDIACSQRYLSIDTYQVIILSGCFGLIQWVDDTKTIQDFINFTLNDEQRRQCAAVHVEYDNWICNAASPRQRIQQMQYKEALIKYDAKMVNNKMTQLTDKIESDLLRRTFLALSPSVENFMFARKNFITTYATMCIAQWILGIGDRHLEHILISIKSGRSMSINFASAFGGGVDQLVPELVPFRLTNQIKGLMKPFDEHDEFAMIMLHVLRALRNNKSPLISYLDVVTGENLNLEEYMIELSLAEAEDERPVRLDRRKIKSVLSKLNGDKPWNITLEELKLQHYDGKYYTRYIGIVSGNDYDHACVRSQILAENNLTPEDQIKCLLDQATDLNILGRMHSGWCPWM